MQDMIFFLKKLVTPVSQNEDRARSEFILNVLLIAVVGLSLTVIVIDLIALVIGISAIVPVWVAFITLSFFIFLYFLSRKGFFVLASFIFLGTFFLLNSYTALTYGIDIPAALLTYALVIVMASVLISTRFAFLITTVVVVAMSLMGYAEHTGFLEVDHYWRNESWIFADLIVIFVMFSIIAVVSWLSNREIEKSLARARRSEADLKKERDSLEITVEARTRELKETQAEKMTQLYRFAEFGRLSSGLFHDLINPLTAVSLNIEKIKNAGQDTRPHIELAVQKTGVAPIFETAAYIDKAVRAAKKVEDMVSAVRKQLSRQETKTLFSVNEEIAQTLEVLSHKAQKSGVAIRFLSHQEVKTYGDAVKFNQVALNLVANAIDSYLPAEAPACAPHAGRLAKEGLEKRDSDARMITMSLSLTFSQGKMRDTSQENGVIIFEVRDKGIGISEENKPKLFEPFFTTKEEGYGLGIGLSMIKRIIKKDFGGSIEVASKEGDGSVFTVKFPQQQNE